MRHVPVCRSQSKKVLCNLYYFLFLPPLSIPQFFLYQLLKRKQLQIFSGEKWASGKFFLKLPFSIYYSEFSLSGISTFNREAFFNGKKFMWHNFFYTFFHGRNEMKKVWHYFLNSHTHPHQRWREAKVPWQEKALFHHHRISNAREK